MIRFNGTCVVELRAGKIHTALFSGLLGIG